MFQEGVIQKIILAQFSFLRHGVHTSCRRCCDQRHAMQQCCYGDDN